MELSQIQCPEDIRGLTEEECVDLAAQMRRVIIQTVSQNGGHLSSNLGVVEITLALHRVFDVPTDKLIFDVGHQCYPHKLLTGRAERFSTLRKYGGLSGFPRSHESPYDVFETGHASTAISAAVGMARARDVLGQKHHVIALVGDGALTGGMCYEALNDCGNTKTKIILVINDNEMSISKNVGALSEYLSAMRASLGWNQAKKRVKKGLSHVPVIGEPLERAIHSIKRSLKSLVVDEGFFSALGFQYIGPIDGHDIGAMEKIFERAKHLDGPVVIHCITKKGYGYTKAEKKPDKFHGIAPFFMESGVVHSKSAVSNGEIAANTLVALAKRDPRVYAVTAAMPLGTNAELFQFAFPERFKDVGIAEEHAVTMCAGLAKGGLLPFFFVYSTFLQRGYDQVMHDVCMQGLPVTFLLDRSGLSNEDGKSHQGLFDIAYLRDIPGITLLAPSCGGELAAMVEAAYVLEAPCAIRYPKDAIADKSAGYAGGFAIGRWQTVMEGEHGTVLAVGSMVSAMLRVAKRLREAGHSLRVVNASTVKPLDDDALTRFLEEGRPLFTVEEHLATGGFGSAVLEAVAARSIAAPVHVIGVREGFIPHGDHQSVLELVGLSDDALYARMLRLLEGEAHG